MIANFGIRTLEHDRFKMKRPCSTILIGERDSRFPAIKPAQRLGPASVVYGLDLWGPGALERARREAMVRDVPNSVFVRDRGGSMPFGDAYDNAMCESFFATLECELPARDRVGSQAEARMVFFRSIEGWNNPVRLHYALSYQSPIAYEKKMLMKA